MKKVIWYSKIVFLLVFMFVTLGDYTDRIARGQDEGFDLEGCNTTKWCGRTSGGGCACGNKACTGCFIQDGDTGCGKCAIN